MKTIQHQPGQRPLLKHYSNLLQWASLIANGSGIIEEVNLLLIQQFGYERRKIWLLGMWKILFPAGFGGRHQQHREGFVANPERRTMGTGRDLYGLKKTALKCLWRSV